MPRIRWVAFGLAAALLAVNGDGRPTAVPRDALPAAEGLEGTWLITSVVRDGAPDPAQIGGSLTFAGGSVTLQPRVVELTDAGVS
jgi:hypothetical protein